MKVLLSKPILASHLQRRFRASFDSFRGSLCGYCGSPNYKSKWVNVHPSLVAQPVPPNLRTWMTFAVPTTLLIVAGVAMLVHYNDERRAIPKGSHQGGGNERTRNRPAFGGPFRLIDSQNHVVTDADLQGNWSLLYFGYTSSPDVGPQEVQKMAEAIDILESKHSVKLKPVFISIDPQRDSPSQLQAYLKEFDPRIIGLTGPVNSIRQTSLEYRVYFKKDEEEGEDYLITTSHNMYLLDPNVEVLKCFTVDYDAEQLCENILKEIKKASSSNKASN
ncbi:protein SCO1 homolog 2, mitochondrial isoform X2 [Aristolochia californica]|uniref:protein SCO1 homolog 2, mitochondrial isoform X2 n=1 Tax=Aristolochia californica TaxID=171875 RepID=UPI0035E30280